MGAQSLCWPLQAHFEFLGSWIIFLSSHYPGSKSKLLVQSLDLNKEELVQFLSPKLEITNISQHQSIPMLESLELVAKNLRLLMLHSCIITSFAFKTYSFYIFLDTEIARISFHARANTIARAHPATLINKHHHTKPLIKYICVEKYEGYCYDLIVEVAKNLK